MKSLIYRDEGSGGIGQYEDPYQKSLERRKKDKDFQSPSKGDKDQLELNDQNELQATPSYNQLDFQRLDDLIYHNNNSTQNLTDQNNSTMNYSVHKMTGPRKHKNDSAERSNGVRSNILPWHGV